MRSAVLLCSLCLLGAAIMFVAWHDTDQVRGAHSATKSAQGASVAPPRCDLSADASTLASQVAAAEPGQTVCLASGSYGTFTGATKSGRVTLRPARGASVDMAVSFNGASNITVTGITLQGAVVKGATHDITLSHSTVPSTGQITVLPDHMAATSDVVIDHDTFVNQSCIHFSLAGRIDVQNTGNNNSNPVGLTISNNYLSGGSADGVRLDTGSGIQVLDNTFTQFNDADPCHADTIQIYGSASHVIMKGNLFYNQQNTAGCSLGMWNGGDHNVFENNVVAGAPNGGCYDALNLYRDNSSTVIHNVFAYGGCLPNGLPSNPCGEVALGGSAGVAGSDTLIRDNIMTGILNSERGPNSTFSEDHNLCIDTCGGPGDQGPGTGDITGAPTFAGGSAPSTFSGFALCAGSPGVGRASDGTNIGLELPAAHCRATASPGLTSSGLAGPGAPQNR